MNEIFYLIFQVLFIFKATLELPSAEKKLPLTVISEPERLAISSVVSSFRDKL